ncbi:thioredoxin domain-containing protein [uncultured Cohaesibacter sp.]|uniref:DsbA family protein n=1 Tax=uncultured Cohaesibacter sp. TaxID=1002546 RepID=UPI00292FFE04|nr:thioredoxin domain-containing protein [uncultured Cohaesibacter sp.]
MALNRRDFLVTGVKATTALTAMASLPLFMAAPAAAESYPIDELLETVELKSVDPKTNEVTIGKLEDITYGKEDAPVVIVEYFSLTCSHCAHFHETGFKFIKENYIDTGKVRYIARNFVSDDLALVGAMVTYKIPSGRRTAMLDLLLRQQEKWAFSKDPLVNLQRLAKFGGFSQKAFEEATKDQDLVNALNASRKRANSEFGVTATPTFFVNGEKYVGAMSDKDFDKILQPLI